MGEISDAAQRRPSPADMPQRRATAPTAAPQMSAPQTAQHPAGSTAIAEVDDLPECMRPGWDPLTPGREAERRFLDACIEHGVDPRELDPDGYWSVWD